jgi:hypothetical protein
MSMILRQMALQTNDVFLFISMFNHLRAGWTVTRELATVWYRARKGAQQ